MKYITGIHAMNIACSLDTCGDWHRSALKWKNITFGDTDKSIFGSYGLEYKAGVPMHRGKYYIANHIRAALDMIDSLDLSNAQGLRENYICNEEYTPIIFDGVKKIIENSDKDKQDKINKFMEREYNWDWYNYMKGHV